MRTQTVATVGLSVLLICGVSAQNGSADKDFMKKAAEGGNAEVDLGNMALEHASNEKVKQFGQQMVQDHSKANDELKSIASTKGVSLPDGTDMSSKATKAHLVLLHGDSFDRAYMQDMVDDHRKDIAEFQKEAESGNDPDVKAFARKTLPTLKHHLAMAEEALNDVRKTSAKK